MKMIGMFTRGRKLIGLIAIAMFCMVNFGTWAGAADKKVVVGSKNFTEQRILSEIMIQLLNNRGFQCEDKTGLGGTLVARKALENGQIDMYMEYTGTALGDHAKGKNRHYGPPGML